MKPIRIWTSRNRPLYMPILQQHTHISRGKTPYLSTQNTTMQQKTTVHPTNTTSPKDTYIKRHKLPYTHISEMILGTYNPIKKKYTYETNSTRLLIIDYLLWDIYEQTSKTTDFQQIKPLILSRYHKILRLNKKMPKLLAYE